MLFRSQQLGWRKAMRTAGKAYRALDAHHKRIWNDYALELGENQPGQNGANAYIRLQSKRLQIDPTASPLALPPHVASPVVDAHVQMHIANSGELVARLELCEKHAIIEVLTQRLASQHRRTYMARYRHHSFVKPNDVIDISDLQDHWYTFASRVVDPLTGECGALTEQLLGQIKAGRGELYPPSRQLRLS